jgi:Bacterial protein of unknown function (DUF885)
MDPRLRAICDLMMPVSREYGGRHEYDGRVQDLSPAGVEAGLAALGGEPYEDPYDEALTASRERDLRVMFGELRVHRWNPFVHLSNLDIAAYDREYAPAEERAEARRRHLAAWPAAVEASIASLDEVPAPTAEACLGAVRGLAAGLDPERDADALAAHARLVAHLEQAQQTGPPSAELGTERFRLLLSSTETIDVDLDALAARADAERDRLRGILEEACGRIAPGRKPEELIPELLRDHPDAGGVIAEAQALTEEVIAWTHERRLVPWSDDGTCLVGPAPDSRSYAMAMMSTAAPGEPDAPSWYYVTPPRPEWPAEEQEEWLTIFSRTTLPAITVHEVAPGHFSHGMALRHAPSAPRRQLYSDAFVEGWAHYVEEVAVEEGFRDGDPHYALGMAIEALVRVTRFACAVGLHTGGMTVEDAAERFQRDAYMARPGALSEARRGTFDPTYGRYTWGKLEILALRERARERWGAEFSLQRFHAALMHLGAPPLGLLDHALTVSATPGGDAG